ncbi:threonylcarbamoyl-AMP synthase [Salinicoccus cyprini]|uniref:Threonylcarbamoyl-AMP synthase n=1 Tax=Salinicoccus cyprini TaxID=2493691 RepID=A0A558ASK5_9STAP|nr:L-threonylcarbamoyladenylate synthase [Salinicoccus cyprini]TVT27250.1 threonylcarbamoyl-AMP synthase [Salinicoccus cyprini]
MKTKIWDIRTDQLKDEVTASKLDEIKTALEYGEVIGIPTETVYGLAGDARNPEAIQKIFSAKNRPGDNPLIVHVHSMDQLADFTEPLDPKVETLMKHFWPGPISFILPLKGSVLAGNTVAELDSVAVRMPSHPVGHAILEKVGFPLAAPSANLSGKPSPTDFSHVIDDLNGKVYGVVASDPATYGLESTVLDCTQFPYRIARPGSITKGGLESVLKEVVSKHHGDDERPIAPGMKYKHYAPHQPLVVVEGGFKNNTHLRLEEDQKVGVIAPESVRNLIPDGIYFISLCSGENDYREAGRNLYAALRKMDKSDVDKIYIHGFPKKEETEALMNRIHKATGNEIIKEESE